MSRRGNGEGSVYRMTDGRWRGAVDLGWENGKRKRKVVNGRTQAEALEKLKEAQRQAEQGVVADGKMTVEAWLAHWLDVVVPGKPKVESPNTLASYEQIVRVHLVPGLGKVRLAKLNADQVDRFLAAKAKAGLARSHVGRMKVVLADALAHAQRRGLVTMNAASLSVMPKCEPAHQRRSLTPAEARALIAAAQGERLSALIVVGLSVGLRPGELTGLLWTDLDLDAGSLTVSGSMKRRPDGSVVRGAVKRSSGGRRTVGLPPVTVDALRAHRGRVAAERLAAGPMWADHGLVFCSELGTPLDSSNVRRMFARVGKRAGLDASFPYLLRHTAVSLLIDSGVSIEEVADLLGDDPQTLYRHYRHKVRPVATAGTRMQAVLENPVATSLATNPAG